MQKSEEKGSTSIVCTQQSIASLYMKYNHLSHNEISSVVDRVVSISC